MKRGILRDAFPAIREIILSESPRLGRLLDKHDIGPKLKEHPRVRLLLRSDYSGEQGGVDQYVQNLVDWYSHKWTRHEANELDPRQATWILPTFVGIRRIESSRSGQAWRYAPIEGETNDLLNLLASVVDPNPLPREAGHMTAREPVPDDTVKLSVSVTTNGGPMPEDGRQRMFGPFMAVIVTNDELHCYHSPDDWEVLAMRVGLDWYLKDDDLPVESLTITPGGGA